MNDLKALFDQVSETHRMVQTLFERLNIPAPTSPPIEESPLNVQQTAELLDVTTATVYDLVHKRRIPNHRPGKRLYFLRSELMDWIKNGRRMTTDELARSATIRETRKPSPRKTTKVTA